MIAPRRDHTLPDAELALAARRGDKRAFVDIVARHQAMVCGIAYGLLGDFGASEDAAQEAFVSAWEKIRELREPEKLRPWLASIARRTALAQLRARRGDEPLEEVHDLASNGPTPLEMTAMNEEAMLVREALADLPETYRLPLVLYYREDRSVRAVAEALELSEDAVKQRLARGRELLRDRMSRVIEASLARSGPSAVFTMTVAMAIGALAAPAVLAGAAFTSTAASAAGSAAGTTPAVVAMTSTQFSVTAAVLVAAACLPVGYAVHFGTDPPASQTAPAAPPVTAVRSDADFAESSLFAEWRRLHDEHGHDAAAMPALSDAIAGIKDPFKRRAFRAALVAEWSELDPVSGFDYFASKKNEGAQLRQLFAAWLDRDPAAAVAALEAKGAAVEWLAAETLDRIARLRPERLAALAARLKPADSPWTRPVVKAFEVLAAGQIASARELAASLEGPNRTDALCGVATVYGRRDGEAALAWAKALPEGPDRDEVVRHVLEGLAEVKPTAALDHLGDVPPGGRDGYFATTLGARILKRAGEADFAATVDWIVGHPGKLAREDLLGLAKVVTDRLNADPAAFLTAQATAGSLEAIMPAIDSAVLNDAGLQCEAIWKWLRGQPAGPAISRLQDGVLNSVGYQYPELALKLAADLPDGAEPLQKLAQSLLNGGTRMDRLDSLLAQSSPQLKDQLLATAFQSLSADSFRNGTDWVTKFDEASEATQRVAAPNLAGAWAGQRPAEAAAWATQLPEGETRAAAVRAVAEGWARKDAFSASQWITELPAGPDRDAGAAALVQCVAPEAPEEAWQWAVAIQDAETRFGALAATLRALGSRDEAAARQRLNEARLSTEERAALERVLTVSPSPVR